MGSASFSQQCGSTATGTTPTDASTGGADSDCVPTLAEACSDGDVGTVKKLLTEGRSVHETTEEGESLLSLACSAGYYELAQVLLAMHASVEDRGIKVRVGDSQWSVYFKSYLGVSLQFILDSTL